MTAPSQVPYRALLPEGIDNLVVPVPLSATHVGFSTIRLEPTWVQIGEAAGEAAALAAERDQSVADVSHDSLQRRLAERGWLLSYVDEFDAATDAPWAAPIQYLSTKGFLRAYDTRPEEALEEDVAQAWAETARATRNGDLNGTERARALPGPLDDRATDSVSLAEFSDLLVEAGIDADAVDAAVSETDVDATDSLTRGDACCLLYALLAP